MDEVISRHQDGSKKMKGPGKLKSPATVAVLMPFRPPEQATEGRRSDGRRACIGRAEEASVGLFQGNSGRLRL